MKVKDLKLYIAEDGTEFRQKEKCLKHDKALSWFRSAVKVLGEHPKGCDFANGGGYLQHDKETFLGFEADFYKAACQFHPGLSKMPMGSYGFWRTLNDSDSPFYSWGQRILCVSRETFREYGQPYYSTHESKAEQKCLNTAATEKKEGTRAD